MTSIDGDTVNTLESAKVGMMFVPGEICTLFGYRAEAYVRDLGYDAGIIVGFTNDHEGYFMTIEDWWPVAMSPESISGALSKGSIYSKRRFPSQSAA